MGGKALNADHGIHEQMVEWRHDFHRHPELEFDLPRTSARVAELLEGFGLAVHRGIGNSGVVGILKKGLGRRAIGIRAEMDALPVTEENAFAHKSAIPGKMHACGHDGHMSMALGAAKRLAEHGSIDGTVVFIFQPNEEHGKGAAAMIDDGLFNRFPVDAVYAIHNIPDMPLGHFSTRTGPVTASEALFEIEINANGGHAALPHMGVDAIAVGSELVCSLQTIVSRKLDPSMNGVVSVTGFASDGRRNVLAGRAVLSGDCRALSPGTNTAIETAMRRLATGICSSHGATARVVYKTIFPATINSIEAHACAMSAGRSIGAIVDGACPPMLFSEDFSHMANMAAGCLVFMGNGTEGEHARPLHSSQYDFNDAALISGASFWVALAEGELSHV
ncbi:MAG: amidohydrolase [Roseovarius sp.]|nr:amidohydrolase [Roseovarius sp.]